MGMQIFLFRNRNSRAILYAKASSSGKTGGKGATGAETEIVHAGDLTWVVVPASALRDAAACSSRAVGEWEGRLEREDGRAAF